MFELADVESIRADKERFELFRTATDFVKAFSVGIVELPKEDKLLEIFGKVGQHPNLVSL